MQVHEQETPGLSFKRDFSAVIFNHLSDAVKKSSTSYGVVVEDTSIKFTQLNRLVRDLAKFSCLAYNKVDEKLQKSYGPHSGKFGNLAEDLLRKQHVISK